MKIYISGKITGLHIDEAGKLFTEAEKDLQGIGHETVNPLCNGLDFNAPWIDHIIRDIELLQQCDAIYLLQNWIESRGAMIEKTIAEMTGKEILYQTQLEGQKKAIEQLQIKLIRIQGAIEEVTGLSFKSYTTKSRNRERYFARLLFTYHCKENGLREKEISHLVNRDHTTILHCRQKYIDELKFNPKFSQMAQDINKRLYTTNK